MGNQMFQYAAARAVAARTQAQLVLDLQWFDEIKGQTGVTPRQYALGPFDLPATERASGAPPAGRFGLVRRALRRFGVGLPVTDRNGTPVFSESSFTYDCRIEGQEAPVQLMGYFQSPRYFAEIAELIRGEFGTPRALSAASRAMLSAIHDTDAVCVHVRRGDYVSDAAASAFHGLCGMDYYARALDHVVQEGERPHCFVFSDDPAWVQGNMRLRHPTTIVDINGPEAAHEDLWLMAACRHFVIANSSLSWWGAWLGLHAQKRVVAPLQWFKDSRHDTRDLIPETWTRL